MTITQIATLVGQTVTIKVESLRVECVVQDCKVAYGSVRLLVEPVRGSGQQWVDQSRVDDGKSLEVEP